VQHKPIKISIITVCRNAERVIERTIRSVLDQDYATIEYIIIDGASTDQTMQIVRQWEARISRVISEPDIGIFDAMNKGVQNASGDFLLFLNAGDFLIHSSAISSVVRLIREKGLHEVDVISARLLVYNPNGEARIWTPRRASQLSFYHGSLPHPSTFQNKKAFHKIGLFDPCLKIAGDYEWFVRGFANALQFHILDILTTVFINDGISASIEWNSTQRKEIELVRARYFSHRFWLNIGRFLRKNKIL